MLLSNDFVLRMVGHLIPQVPTDKAEVFDNTFESVMRKLGQHQVFVDISRCKKLTSLPFGCFQLCKSLLYLDISYTKLNDLTVICENCYDLRALNITGLELMDTTYQKVSCFPALEVLVMRNCNVTNTDWLEILPSLRSLDLGGNVLTSDPIWYIRNLSRLEEIILDCASFPIELKRDFTPEYAHMNVLCSLPVLTLLNINETGIESFKDQIIAGIGRHICVEDAPRRWLMIAAIASNDYHQVQRLLTTGYDIDMRISLADEARLAKLWRQRCTTAKLRAPFFMCSAADAEHRPTALHVAIYFNALECVQLLLDYGADDHLAVWFSDVKEIEGKFVENVSLSAKQPRKIFNARQLVEGVFQRNIHRITADLVGKKVAGWKAVLTLWYKRLLFVFNAPRGGNRPPVDEIDRRMASLWVDTTPNDVTAAGGGGDGGGGGGGGGGGAEEAITPAAATAPTSARKINGFPAEGVEAGEGLRSEQVGIVQKQADENNEQKESKEQNEEKSREEREGNDNSVDLSATSSKIPAFKQEKIMQQKQRLFDWRGNGMVEKIMGKPVMVSVKVPAAEEPPATPALVKKGRGRESIRASSRPGGSGGLSMRSGGSISIKPSTGSTGSMGMGVASAASMKAANSWVNQEPEQKFDIIQLPLLGKHDFWLESRALVIKAREEEYERCVLPELGVHKLDAVERTLLNASKFRPGQPVAASIAGAGAGSGQDLRQPTHSGGVGGNLSGWNESEEENDMEEESESMDASGDHTPGFISNFSTATATPFIMSPPGSASMPVRSALYSRESTSRGRSSTGAGAGGLGRVDENGMPIPDPSMLAATASMKRLSSSERRERFFVQLSQRMEDRFMPED